MTQRKTYLTIAITCLVIAVISTLFTGCAWTNVARKVTTPDGLIYTVEARGDDMISFKTPDFEIVIDGRGRPGMIEQALGIMFMNLPDVSIDAD